MLNLRLKRKPIPAVIVKSRLRRLQVIEKKCFRQRQRFAFYEYLGEVIVLYTELIGRPGGLTALRKAVEQMDLASSPGTHGLRIIINATSQTDDKTKSKWTRALRYAWLKREKWFRLKNFLQRRDGVAGCAKRYAAICRKRTRVETPTLIFPKVISRCVPKRRVSRVRDWNIY